ncbi:hypothetical protein ES332_A12G101500v1 [Gossypium tomentosum]|uniref:Uncharacterized protein n=1 Tax=Gossypium tomentosum TaxID=34277 RepID=A0A5D2MV25_GOSTO|nr:hypothetical protein ES332_A12G101500v1 [Gossypium tomentosum]
MAKLQSSMGARDYCTVEKAMQVWHVPETPSAVENFGCIGPRVLGLIMGIGSQCL